MFLQDPTGCYTSTTSRTTTPFPATEVALLDVTRPLPTIDFASVSAYEHPDPTSAGHGLLHTLRRELLLRKEVIQPHLPVRLPCYDFVPIASPTFDHSLPQAG